MQLQCFIKAHRHHPSPPARSDHVVHVPTPAELAACSPEQAGPAPAAAAPPLMALDERPRRCCCLHDDLQVLALLRPVSVARFNTFHISAAFSAIARAPAARQPVGGRAPPWDAEALRQDQRISDLFGRATELLAQRRLNAFTHAAVVHAAGKRRARRPQTAACWADPLSGQPPGCDATQWPSCVRGLRPPAPFLTLFWATSAELLRKSADSPAHGFNPQGLSTLLLGLAKLGLPPPAGWAAAYWDASQTQINGFSPQACSPGLAVQSPPRAAAPAPRALPRSAAAERAAGLGARDF